MKLAIFAVVGLTTMASAVAVPEAKNIPLPLRSWLHHPSPRTSFVIKSSTTDEVALFNSILHATPSIPSTTATATATTTTTAGALQPSDVAALFTPRHSFWAANMHRTSTCGPSIVAATSAHAIPKSIADAEFSRLFSQMEALRSSTLHSIIPFITATATATTTTTVHAFPKHVGDAEVARLFSEMDAFRKSESVARKTETTVAPLLPVVPAPFGAVGPVLVQPTGFVTKAKASTVA